MESREEQGVDIVHQPRDVRGAEIILRTHRRRLVFLGGLIASTLFGLIAAWLAISSAL